MDEPIHALMQAGRHDEAFALLLPAYRRKALGLCYGLLGDRAAAEDAAQEAFVKIWRALPGFDGRAALSTWIYAIVRNTALSQLRKRRAESSLSDPAVLEAAEAVAAEDDGDDPVDQRRVRELVTTLPEKERVVVSLFYLQDRSVDEVAAQLGMPSGTVKTLLFRARARLADKLRTPAVAAA